MKLRNRSVLAALFALSLSLSIAHAAPKVKSTNPVPKPDAPKVEPAPVEAPKVEAPKVEAPKVEAPKEVAAAQAPAAETDKWYGKDEGLLGDFKFGPSVSAISFPHLFQGALEMKYQDFLSGAFTYGFWPTLTVSSVKIGMNAYNGRVRWHPFKGSFMLGAIYGVQTLTAKKSDTISGVPAEVAIELKTYYLTPHLGWRWEWNSGFFMGVDLGWQLNHRAKLKVTTNAPAVLQTTQQYIDLNKDVVDKGNDIGNTDLPWFTFLHLGFFL